MPEGHVIHRLARRLTQCFQGPVEVSSPQGRFAQEAALIDGHRLLEAEAFGKHLFIHFDNPQPESIVYIHLGLIGSLRFEPIEDIWGQIRLRLVSPSIAANLRGPQFCRLITSAEYSAKVASIGADPLRSDSQPRITAKKVLKSRRSIGSLLMDQKLYAGVGNIYRAEVLFRQHISPFTPGNELSTAQIEALWADLVYLMAEGVRTGRIDTVREEHSPESMQRPAREDDHGGEVYVYRRAGQACYICGGEISLTEMEGRNLFWCPSCQP